MFGSQPSTSSMANMSNSSGGKSLRSIVSDCLALHPLHAHVVVLFIVIVIIAPLLLSSDRCVSRTSPIIQFTASSPDNKYLQSNQTLVRSSFTQPLSILRRTHNVKPSSSSFVSSPMPRSVTMNIIDRDTVIKARNSPAAAGVRTSLRQSLSAESLVDLMNGKKKKVFKEFGRSSFVRKVATSFRFKKAEKGEKEVDKEEEFRTLTISPPQASRSLPQSPRTDRRAGKKYGTLGWFDRCNTVVA